MPPGLGYEASVNNYRNPEEGDRLHRPGARAFLRSLTWALGGPGRRPSGDTLSSQQQSTGGNLGLQTFQPGRLWASHSPGEDPAGAACKAEEHVLLSLGRDTPPAVTSLRGSAARGPLGCE